MAEFIPPLGTADPQIFMDNVRRLDQLMQSSELTFPDRAGELLYTWRGIHQTLIPLSKQYITLAAAQADIVNIPVNATTYVRSQDGSALAVEYLNNSGTLQATGRKMPSRSSVLIGVVDSWVNSTIYPFDTLISKNENSLLVHVGAVSSITYREAYSDLAD
ncbi:flagellar biosynthesis protein, partial [Klebsiella pneumoniae]